MSDLHFTLVEHKAVSPTVFAFKIASIVKLEDGTGRTVLAPAGDKPLALIVDEAFSKKWKASVGDYFVGSVTGQQAIMSAQHFECPDFGYAAVQKA